MREGCPLWTTFGETGSFGEMEQSPVIEGSPGTQTPLAVQEANAHRSVSRKTSLNKTGMQMKRQAGSQWREESVSHC